MGEQELYMKGYNDGMNVFKDAINDLASNIKNDHSLSNIFAQVNSIIALTYMVSHMESKEPQNIYLV